MQKSSMALATVVAAMALCAGEGAWGASFQTLYSFKGGADGVGPNTLVALHGMLYGTTFHYPDNNGTVFSLTTAGTETVLYRFNGSDGWLPDTLMAFDGYLFGATQFGGPQVRYCQEANGIGGCGVVFGLAPASSKERILQSFPNAAAGLYASPGPGGLVDLGGAIYEAVSVGGAYNNGAVVMFRGGVETVIYSFKGGMDGSGPSSLIRIGAALYGTTGNGGGKRCKDCGTIFKLTPDGTETVLHAFDGANDGKQPGSLVNGGGDLYAVVATGGAGFGKVIKLRAGKVQTVYAFQGGNDGAYPASLTRIGDTLYGTTYNGGASSDGTLFSLTKEGQETVLHTFSGSDGAQPGPLIQDGGAVYGATYGGGSASAGTVFSFTR